MPRDFNVKIKKGANPPETFDTEDVVVKEKNTVLIFGVNDAKSAKVYPMLITGKLEPNNKKVIPQVTLKVRDANRVLLPPVSLRVSTHLHFIKECQTLKRCTFFFPLIQIYLNNCCPFL